MLNWCRAWLLLARSAMRRPKTIVSTTDVTGSDAPVADDTEIQPRSDDGLNMADDVLIARKRAAAEDAIQDLMRSMYGTLVTVDWLVLADNVVSVEDEDTHVLHPAYSAGMSSWKASGMVLTGVKYYTGGM